VNATPSFQEDHISQVPALQLLQNLGYTYLRPQEVSQLVEQLAERRCCDCGRGFSATDLWDMKRFHEVFEILQTVSRESEPNNAESRKANGC
jgi:hypothetical protein